MTDPMPSARSSTGPDALGTPPVDGPNDGAVGAAALWRAPTAGLLRDCPVAVDFPHVGAAGWPLPMVGPRDSHSIEEWFRLAQVWGDFPYQRPETRAQWAGVRASLRSVLKALAPWTGARSVGWFVLSISGAVAFVTGVSELDPKDPIPLIVPCVCAGAVLMAVLTIVATARAARLGTRLERLLALFDEAAPSEMRLTRARKVCAASTTARAAWNEVIDHAQASGVPLLVGDMVALHDAERAIDAMSKWTDATRP